MANTRYGPHGKRKPDVGSRLHATRTAQTIRRRLAAAEARVAYPVPKKGAARLGLTARTVQRWRSVDYAEGSPFHRVMEAIEASDDPASLLAFLESVTRRVVMDLPNKPTKKLAAEYRALLAQDADVEGADNSHKVSRGVDWVDRFLANRADAKVDLRLAAYALEFAYRGLSESEVFDG